MWSDSLTAEIVDGCCAKRRRAQSFGSEPRSMDEGAPLIHNQGLGSRLVKNGPSTFFSCTVEPVTDLIEIHESDSGEVVTDVDASKVPVI